MNQINCADGVRITSINADNFKRCRISVNFVWENTRNDATSAAILPYLLERGYADCPDMTELSKKLAALYGAELSSGISSAGANRVLSVSVSGLQDKFAINGEKLSVEYLKLALGAAFRPSLDENGLFTENEVNIEREKLREGLECEINEKRSYCIRQARRRFFENTPMGVEVSGYLDEVDTITPQSITAAYDKMLETARIELIILGIDEQTAKESLLENMNKLKRGSFCNYSLSAQNRVKPERFTQDVDAVQGKLCLLFTSGTVFKSKEFSAARVAVAFLGSTPTSRLFMNVREKQSLCYYCAASFAYTTGVLCIDCGIEHENAVSAKEAILAEIDKMINGPINEDELSDTKRSLINSLNSMKDSLSGLEGWYFSEIIRGSLKSPQQAIDEINAVCVADIKKAIKSFSLSVEYVLTQKGDANE